MVGEKARAGKAVSGKEVGVAGEGPESLGAFKAEEAEPRQHEGRQRPGRNTQKHEGKSKF